MSRTAPARGESARATARGETQGSFERVRNEKLARLVADRVYELLQQELRVERERRGPR